MNDQYLSEGFGAALTSFWVDVLAQVRLLSCVDPHVLLERRILRERLSTPIERTRSGNYEIKLKRTIALWA